MEAWIIAYKWHQSRSVKNVLRVWRIPIVASLITVTRARIYILLRCRVARRTIQDRVSSPCQWWIARQRQMLFVRQLELFKIFKNWSRLVFITVATGKMPLLSVLLPNAAWTNLSIISLRRARHFSAGVRGYISNFWGWAGGLGSLSG